MFVAVKIQRRTKEKTETFFHAARDRSMRPERMVEMGRGIESSFQTGDLTPNPQQTYTLQESGPSMSRDQSVAFCLGQQPHPMRAEEVVCRHCGCLVAGTRLGVYQVQRQLGRGRNGSAYLAVHV